MIEEADPGKRGYDLRKRLENMDQTRRAVLTAARQQLEAEGYRLMTMSSLAAQSGITRQTIHNLFGSKRGVLEALFDSIALESGMDRMREVMGQTEPEAVLLGFVQIFSTFWQRHPVLIRRIHAIAALDPEFGMILNARNRRRAQGANAIARRIRGEAGGIDEGSAIAALTSFEFYDALTLSGRSASDAEGIIFRLAAAALNM